MVHRGRGHGRGRHGPRMGSRSRWWMEDPGRWEVHARIERFVEPALLLALRDHEEMHGYALAEAIEAFDPAERVDLGNLYRLLRSLEEEGFVGSTWRDDLPGRSKRTYRLTEQGRALLDAWARALGGARHIIDEFLNRHEEGAEQ